MPTTAPPHPRLTPSDRRLIGIAAGLTTIIFLVDLELPRGITVCALYGVVILLGLFVRVRGFSLWAAIVVTLLTTVAAWLSPPGAATVVVVVNRGLTIVGIWVTAWLVTRYANTGMALDRSIKDLADTSFALNQAAIVATTNVKGEITFVNDKFVEISKYPREELLGQDHRIINSGYHSKEFIRDLWHTIANGRIWRGELRNRAKDGAIYWVDTTIVPFLDDRGKPWQYMAIRHDITERKHQEQRLREQAALTSIGEMAAVVAHEVRNPLAGLRSGLQMLSSSLHADREGLDLLRDMIARLDSLNSVLSDLLTFARVRELKLAPLDLRVFLDDLTSSLRLDPAMAGIDIRISDGNDLTLQADSDQLRLVLMNLVINAAQAMNGRGRIDVGVAAIDNQVELTITDAGPGIPMEIRERIFEPFFTTKHRGTGLGLPTAKRIVEAHDGRLVVEDAPAGGTTVRVWLPRRAQAGE